MLVPRDLCLPCWDLLREPHSQQQGQAELDTAGREEDPPQPELHRQLRAGNLQQGEAPVQLQVEGEWSGLQQWRQGYCDIRQ